MEQSAIFAPVLTLAGWTMLVLLLVPYRRFKAGAERRVTAEDFRFGESVHVPSVAFALTNIVLIAIWIAAVRAIAAQ